MMKVLDEASEDDESVQDESEPSETRRKTTCGRTIQEAARYCVVFPNKRDMRFTRI